MNMNTLPKNTPWGTPDQVETVIAGIYRVDTPSHGGFWVCPDLNQLIPLEHRNASFCGQGHQGWYEEDCDWAIPALAFKEEFGTYYEKKSGGKLPKEKLIADAVATLKQWKHL